MRVNVLLFFMSIFVGTICYLVGRNDGSKNQFVKKREVNYLDVRTTNRRLNSNESGQSIHGLNLREQGNFNDSVSNELVPKPYRERAKALLEFLKVEEKFQETKFSEKQISEESNSIALRLVLNEDQKEKLKALIKENFTIQESYENSVSSSLEQTLGEMTEKKMLDYMALELLQESVVLDEEQQFYFNELEHQFITFENGYYESSDFSDTEPVKWQDDPAIIAKINDFLQPDQQDELRAYLVEGQERIVEGTVFYRTEELTSRLGLDSVEKAHLRVFLEQNPNANDQEVSEVLDPALAEILLKN